MPGSGAAAASYGDLLITSVVVLAAVCVAAFVVVRLVGRFLSTGRARGGHLLDVVARLSLEPRRSLYVVDVAGKTLLVGTSEMGLSVLTELDGGEVRARNVPRQSFGELVREAWTRRGGTSTSPEHDREAGGSGASAETTSAAGARTGGNVSAETVGAAGVRTGNVSAETVGAAGARTGENVSAETVGAAGVRTGGNGSAETNPRTASAAATTSTDTGEDA